MTIRDYFSDVIFWPTKVLKILGNLFESGELIRKNSVYGDHRGFCITFSLREMKNGNRIGDMTISISDAVYTYSFSQTEMHGLMKAMSRSWGDANSAEQAHPEAGSTL